MKFGAVICIHTHASTWLESINTYSTYDKHNHLPYMILAIHFRLTSAISNEKNDFEHWSAIGPIIIFFVSGFFLVSNQ